MTKIAIIGTGIAGLGCGHFLHRDCDVTLFEQNRYAGGHTNTVTAPEPGTGRAVPIDTGFMVFNQVTYPQLTRLFTELAVPIKPTTMSFSVRHSDSGIEFCGSSLNHLFAQRRNLFRPRFYRMLAAINRFNREAVAALGDPAVQEITLGDYVTQRGYGDDFLRLYLTPMSSAVWSTPPDLMLQFPATKLLRFFHNHGFLGLHTQHPWWTVDGGAREYVQRLTAPWRDRIRLGVGARRIVRANGRVTVETTDGDTQHFDRVILACHGDQALALLDQPTAMEARVLGAFHYQPNVATLHTDPTVMPRTRLAWSSWNYEVNRDPAGRSSTATHYWMNALQGVSDRENYFVSIERPEQIDPKKVLRTIHYRHPLFSLGAVRAQAALPRLNELAAGTTETFFAGSYFRYGFHEDAFLSAVQLCQRLLRRDPWLQPAASALVHA
ncbi:MAG: FAD-dependent oxidoreductase [Opitutaceae bacterium]|nr:FAD-dependent oxidoreductase [Opitutaceae bacterium]MBP9912457.1 FAD-dependent oxidoreductase [Opitutaceae bacterium]